MRVAEEKPPSVEVALAARARRPPGRPRGAVGRGCSFGVRTAPPPVLRVRDRVPGSRSCCRPRYLDAARPKPPLYRLRTETKRHAYGSSYLSAPRVAKGEEGEDDRYRHQKAQTHQNDDKSSQSRIALALRFPFAAAAYSVLVGRRDSATGPPLQPRRLAAAAFGAPCAAS